MSKKTITVTRKKTENGIQHSIEKMQSTERNAVVAYLLPYLDTVKTTPVIRVRQLNSKAIRVIANGGIEFKLVCNENETVVANLEKYMQEETISCKMFGRPHTINLVFTNESE